MTAEILAGLASVPGATPVTANGQPTTLPATVDGTSTTTPPAAAGAPAATTPATGDTVVTIPAFDLSFDEMTPEQLADAARALMDAGTALVEDRDKWKGLKRTQEKELKALKKSQASANPPGTVHNGDQPPAGQPTGDTAETERLRQENLRLRVGMQKQLPAELVDRLRGDDLDEMLEDADRLIALVKPTAPQRPQGRGDGGTGKAPVALSPAQEFANLINGGRR